MPRGHAHAMKLLMEKARLCLRARQHLGRFEILLREEAWPCMGDLSHLPASRQMNLVDEYGRHMARIARTLFDAIAVDLNLDRTMLSSYLLEDDGTFRIYRYPKCTNANDYLAMEAHTDSSILSIVNQDEVGGLQIWQNDGWFNIEPISNTLVINLGDLMQAISNDEYMSIEHRVSVNESKARVSLCYFGFPTDSCSISSAKYRKFTYKEFKMQMQEDIKAFGSKVGLKRFKIDAQNA
ncbi:hypothetical protein ZIOFF_013852 [Zingiber officinale]|uniref:Fe2OG dioxygenase domain-containing protein n=1 Tax=Zingiber officinale TaxID=94328 RepID=A0A8J5LQZ9_ZINOF|nr:hypothetical protein ZIOFF_013852 [Zingiber officinale]